MGWGIEQRPSPRTARATRPQPAPPRGRGGLRATPLVAQDELAAGARGEHAFGVRVATPARVAFGRDQHVLAERGQAMTAERAPIRRGLAIRRAPNRPPWSLRKFRSHRSILAPSGGSPTRAPLKVASLATALAIAGVSVAFVRRPRVPHPASGERRSRRPGSASLLLGEPSAPGLRRVVVGQLDLAIELLEGYPGESGEHTVHEIRKALKRARALVRLLRDELEDKRFAGANTQLRDCARRLAGARDAMVMLEALDGLVERHPALVGATSGASGASGGADGPSAVRALRAELIAERDAARVPAEVPRQVAAELWTVRAQVASLDLSGPERASPKLLAGGLEGLARQGRRRMRRARRQRRDVAAMHAWRKSAKDLRYVAETLERADVRRGKPERRLRRDARRADRLGEMLGEEHDLALLQQRVRAYAKRRGLGKRAHRELSRALERRRKRLRKRALREGARLYERKPRRFVRRVRGAL